MLSERRFTSNFPLSLLSDSNTQSLYCGKKKCIWFDKKQPQSKIHIPFHRWQALLAIHKHLLQEHEHFFSMSQMPSARAAIRDAPYDYAMFNRMWRYGIYSPLELLHQSLPGSLGSMLHFIYHVSSRLNRFLEFDPALGVIFIGNIWQAYRGIGTERLRTKIPISVESNIILQFCHTPTLFKSLSYLTKAFVSVQPLCHSWATIDIFFDHWKGFTFQRDMAAHFVIAHRLLLENCSGERLKALTNDFLSLFPMHIQRSTSRNQHEVYIMSCNIASVLGYGTPVYPQVADLFSKKQSSGAANESAPAMETEYLKLNQAFQAIRLTFQTLFVLLRYSNFPNAIPGIHISLAFLWRVSFHRSVMESLEATVPWQAVAGFLNSLFSHNTVFSRIQDEKFPIGEYETAPQLPEDFLIRGQVWSQFYYPNNFFKDTSGYSISIDEMDSEEVVRRHRCLWLGVQIAKVS
ncbi:Pc19g00720 [Penicillium rubens Wisconsin 54-1255]|uniref:Pc19g00720 protein n=1 Tax=Penicillium rubens (strain ATCC 28089 / DSM 1075 / NRRL 1951 / Wisconsin 54-1255) TaxID=500485 RepID=B6HD59_PENRW|nr:Pc19g00720 [Penicillium rubens Wisconsin 54-1255]